MTTVLESPAVEKQDKTVIAEVAWIEQELAKVLNSKVPEKVKRLALLNFIDGLDIDAHSESVYHILSVRDMCALTARYFTRRAMPFEEFTKLAKEGIREKD